MTGKKKTVYDAAAVLAVIFWSASFIGTKIAYQSFPPLTVCLLRFAIAAVLLFLVRAVRHEKERPDRRDLPLIVLSALLGISVYYSVENVALTMTGAAAASLISGAYPAITALVGILFYHLKLSVGKAAGIAMAMLGVFVLTGSGNKGGGMAWAGNALMIFNGFLWAFYNFLIPRISRSCSVLTLTFYQTVIGVVFLIPGAAAEYGSWGPMTLQAAGALLFLAVFCSVGAYLLYNFGLRGISETAAASIMNLMPVFGLLFSALILHEAVGIHHIIGGAVVIAGVLLSAG